MRKLVYHVGTTLDNFIAHQDGTTDGFLFEGDHVTDYLASLQTYDTVLMGKATYEYGYAFGAQPGQPAYPNMKHYIFSKTIQFEAEPSPLVEVVDHDEVDFVKNLKQGEGSPLYLCGGGKLAAFLLEQQLIDQLLIKLYPAVFGSGIRLFGESEKPLKLALLDSKTYETGVVLLRYEIQYLPGDRW